MFRRKRHLRNKLDMHDLRSDKYELDRFGDKRVNKIKDYDAIMNINEAFSSYLGGFNIPILLEPYYSNKINELKTLYKLITKQKVCKKDFTSVKNNQTIFTPQILLYLIFMSEDHILKKYLKCWKKYRSDINLKIDTNLITPNLRTGCGCTGCFGECVRIAYKYKLLPDIINHEQIEFEKTN